MTTLLVASSGGHLAQLHQLRPRLAGIGEDVMWVTFDTSQSRSLLEGERVHFVEHTVTRDYRNVVGNAYPAARLLRKERIDAVVSTGAGVALSFLPVARARRIEAHYIESATRADGPSLTGRLLQSVPGISLYTQHQGWAGGRWQFAGSVFDGYTATEARFPRLRRAVVTLGAHRLYGFRRLVERLAEIMPSGVEVLWQTGCTDVSGLPIDARPFVPAAELDAAIRDADLVVSHAGIGSALTAMEAGRSPVIVPRDPGHGEHVDDHQLQVARELGELDIALVRDPAELTLDDLLRAAARRVRRSAAPPAFVLRAPAQARRPVATAAA